MTQQGSQRYEESNPLRTRPSLNAKLKHAVVRRDAAANLRHIARHGRSCGQHLFAMIERIPLPPSLLDSDSEAAHDRVASVYGCQSDYCSRAVLFLREFDVQSLVKLESRTM